MTEISAAGNIRRDRYNFIFAMFLAVTALLMLLYELPMLVRYLRSHGDEL